MSENKAHRKGYLGRVLTVEGSNQQESWVKCHYAKYCRVWLIKKSTIKDVINGIRDVINGISVYLSPSTMWFEEEPRGSWWACNTRLELHRNESDLDLYILFISVWFAQGVTCHQISLGSSSNHTILEETFALISFIMPLIVNILTTHTLQHFTWWHLTQLPCWSEPSIGSLFWDLKFLLHLFSWSMTIPTNQHETLQRVLSSLTWFCGKLPKKSPIPLQANYT